MKARREDIEKFDAYIRGEMDSEQLLLFESALATDDELNEEFELHRMVTAGIAAEKEARFRKLLDQQRQDTFIGNNTWGRKFTIASAAIVTLGFLAVIFATYRMNNPSKGIAQNEPEDDKIEINPAEVKEGEETVEPDSKKAIQYSKDELKELDRSEDVEIEENANALREESDKEIGQADFKHELDNGIPLDNIPEQGILEDKKKYLQFDTEEDADDVSIAKDQLITSESVEIKQVRYADIQPTSVQGNISLDGLAKKKSRAKTSTSEKESVVTSAPADSVIKASKEKLDVELRDTAVREKKSERITVEYFKSPLNYKGYTYDSRLKKIKVYGLGSTKSTLLRLNNVLYLKNGSDYYKMIPTKEYIQFNRVTDKNLISTLSQ